MTKQPLRLPPSSIIIRLYNLGFAPLLGRLILLLTTTGRKTGLQRITPLQYEMVDGQLYIGSARGAKADWFRNILADPHVRVRVKSMEFDAIAEPATDYMRVADFLEIRLRRHPRMVGMILKSEGLPPCPSRSQLEAYSRGLAMVIIRPREADATTNLFHLVPPPSSER